MAVDNGVCNAYLHTKYFIQTRARQVKSLPSLWRLSQTSHSSKFKNSVRLDSRNLDTCVRGWTFRNDNVTRYEKPALFSADDFKGMRRGTELRMKIRTIKIEPFFLKTPAISKFVVPGGNPNPALLNAAFTCSMASSNLVFRECHRSRFNI